jgi:hypothetical protein
MITNKKTRVKLFALAILVMFAASIASVFSVTSAAPAGTLAAYRRGTTEASWSYPEGSYIIGAETFEVSVMISSASNIWGWGIDNVTWNPAVVELTHVLQGNYLKDPENGPIATIFIKGAIDVANGVLVNGVGAAVSEGKAGEIHSSLSAGELCYFRFKIIGTGDANIRFDGFTLNDGLTPTLYKTLTSPTVTVEGNYDPSNGTIDVFTDKGGVGIGARSGAYGPQQLVSVYTKITHPTAAIDNIEVSFTVSYIDTIFNLRSATTNSSGYASIDFRLPLLNSSSSGMVGNWTIKATASLNEATLSDATQFPFGYLCSVGSIEVPSSVHRSDTLLIKIPVSSVDNTTIWSKLTVTLFDQAQIPIGSYSITNTESIANELVNATVLIPDWAFTGQATAYICLLSADNAALMPETSVNFNILPKVTAGAPDGLFVVPEYALAGLAALSVSLAAFFSFNAVKRFKKPITAQV